MNLKLSIVNYQLSIFLILFFTLPLKAQVTIGSQKAPHSYSVLELASTKGGFRLPMLSNDERDALKLTSDSTEASGLFIYNTDIDCVEFWSGGKWIDLCSATPASSIMNSITLTSAAGTDAQTVCGGAAITPITYSTTGATGATFIGLPVGVTGSWNAGAIAISGTPATNGNYIVVLTGGNGSGMAIGTITVNKVLSEISGNNGVTKGATDLIYSVIPIGATTYYTWTVPTDWSITSGQGTASITVTAGTTEGPVGAITVRANNGNCTGTSTLAVSVGCPVKTTSGNWLTFMCYNLGADENMSIADQMAYVPKNSLDETVYGSLYQWGRQADGHQLRTSPSYPTNDTSPEIGTVSGSDLDVNGQVATTSAAYGKFIKANDGVINDWRSPTDTTLWYNNGKAVNDPCPDGWHVPTVTEWQSIMRNNDTAIFGIPVSGISFTSGNKWVWSNTATQGWLIIPSGSSAATLFLPSGGYRGNTTSALNMPDTFGYYWISSSSGKSAHCMYFSSENINPSPYSVKANGMSVRCVTQNEL